MEKIVSPIYIPSAPDLQDILIRELYDPKPVNESEVDGSFDEIARIKDIYIYIYIYIYILKQAPQTIY